MPGSKRAKTAYWIFTILFCLMMGFTVYAQLCLPQVAQVCSRLGFPNYFRIELCWAKLAGLLVLILPKAPPRLKEWAYAGFTIVLVSALIAHLSVGDGPEAWSWSVGYLVLGALSLPQLPHDCAFLGRPGFRTARPARPGWRPSIRAQSASSTPSKRPLRFPSRSTIMTLVLCGMCTRVPASSTLRR